MLKLLTVRNFAVIESISVDFKDGLNLLTGETGSGKSIIVDALGLLMGDRGSLSQIRTGEKSAFIEGTFELSGDEAGLVTSILDEAGVNDQGQDEIIIRREVVSGGKTRIFINDRSVGVSLLRRLQPLLVEIHGQGEQKLLRSGSAQLDLLDDYAGCQSMRKEVGDAFAIYKTTMAELQTLTDDSRERERNLEICRHQLAEIDAVSPNEGEDDELARVRLVMANAERILESCGGAYVELYESDNSVLASVAGITRRIREVSDVDSRLDGILNSLDEGAVLLSEAAQSLRTYVDGIDFSQDEFARVDNRLSDIESIKRKFGSDLKGIFEIRESLAQDLEKLVGLSDEKHVLERRLDQARKSYAEKAGKLSRSRKAAAVKFERDIAKELPRVALQHARLTITLETATTGDAFEVSEESSSAATRSPDPTVAGDAYYSSYGADRITLLFSANPGEDLRPLSQVASGGELSRLMLTLLTASTKNGKGHHVGGTSIFDEIDSGIGGGVAEAVGRRLKSLAKASQVLCVTHQPQIARFADAHFLVQKQIVSGRTVTSVDLLDEEKRVREVARMIAGDEEAKTTIETARWMISSG